MHVHANGTVDAQHVDTKEKSTSKVVASIASLEVLFPCERSSTLITGRSSTLLEQTKPGYKVITKTKPLFYRMQ